MERAGVEGRMRERERSLITNCHYARARDNLEKCSTRPETIQPDNSSRPMKRKTGDDEVEKSHHRLEAHEDIA